MNEYERILQRLYLEPAGNPGATWVALSDLLRELARREREEQAEAQKMVGG